MKIQHVFRTLAVFILVLVMLAATQPAFADSAGTYHRLDIDRSGSFTFTVDDPGNPCDIPFTQERKGFLRINYWTDELGRITKEVDIYGTLKVNLVGTNGKVINVQWSGPLLYSLDYDVLGENTVLDIITSVGAFQLFTIPHYGRVNGGGGQVILVLTFDTTDPDNWIPIAETQTIKEVGNSDFDHWDIICSYLGGALK